MKYRLYEGQAKENKMKTLKVTKLITKETARTIRKEYRYLTGFSIRKRKNIIDVYDIVFPYDNELDIKMFSEFFA